MILIFRAQFLAAAARPDQPILVLCFNRTLADRIQHLLRERGVDERVQVRTFHSWCQDLVRSYQLDVPRELKGDAYFSALALAVERAVESGRVPGGQYLALLIDEAHDFEDAWLRIAGRMVSPAPTACWCCTTTHSPSTRAGGASSTSPASASRRAAAPASCA